MLLNLGSHMTSNFRIVVFVQLCDSIVVVTIFIFRSTHLEGSLETHNLKFRTYSVQLRIGSRSTHQKNVNCHFSRNGATKKSGCCYTLHLFETIVQLPLLHNYYIFLVVLCRRKQYSQKLSKFFQKYIYCMNISPNNAFGSNFYFTRRNPIRVN